MAHLTEKGGGHIPPLPPTPTLVSILLPKYIRFPSGDKSSREVVDGFMHKLGFPQCAGVVDGTHVLIVFLVEYPTAYYNRKGFHPILMQCTVKPIIY